ncbi:MAG: hypothetical protein K9G49_15405, partial [Taibaiella sp.]|nr:hypothetical protein [Taibaiella sp.]
MRKNYFFFAFLLTFFAGFNTAFSQMSGTNCFLKGQWLEIGVLNNGAFGAGGIPPGYHPHLGGAVPSGSFLAETYDMGQDGWLVGAPSCMGDYTYPGYPFEGWGLQVNVGRTHAFQSGGYMNTAGGPLTGTVTGYTKIGGSARAYWAGTASGGGLQVRQET